MNQLRAWADSLLDLYYGVPDDEPDPIYSDSQRLAVYAVVLAMAGSYWVLVWWQG